MVYNESDTKLTLQAYEGTTGAGYNSKIILNGGGTWYECRRYFFN